MKKYLIAFVLSMGVDLIVALTRGFIGSLTALAIGYSLFTVFTILICRRFNHAKPWLLVLVILLGPLVIESPARIFAFERSLISLDGFVLNMLAVIVAALICYVSKMTPRIISGITGFAIALFMVVMGHNYWLHKLNYGTFTGRLAPKDTTNYLFAGRDETGQPLSVDMLGNKWVLLNFWFTRCTSCIEEFPQLDKLATTYADRKDMLILSVNRPIMSDSLTQAFDMIKNGGYTFKTVVADDEQVYIDWGVNRFPTTIVLDKTGRMIFYGSLKNAEKLLSKL